MHVELLTLFCPTCARDCPVEAPPCPDGHAECPDRACTLCGTALLLGAPGFAATLLGASVRRAGHRVVPGRAA